MYYLIPSSESKVEQGFPGNIQDDGLLKARLDIAENLYKSNAINISINHTKYHAINKSIILNNNLLPAWQRYNGVVYKYLKLSPELPLTNILICSPFMGLVSAEKLVPNYKLGFDSKIDGIGKLSNFWNKNLSAHTVLKQPETFVDLLTKNQRKIIPYPLGSTVYFVDFLDKDKNLIGHLGKETKGKFLRKLLDESDKINFLDTYQESNVKITVYNT